MRRLILATVVAAALVAESCQRREKIRLEPTEEGSVSLSSTVRMANSGEAFQLVKGFHQIEEKAWRWTMGRFAITLRTPVGAAGKGGRLVVRFTAPEPVLHRLGAITLTALFRQEPLGSITCHTPGSYELIAELAAASMQAETVTFDFVLDKFLPAGSLDGRELGVIVSSIGLSTL